MKYLLALLFPLALSVHALNIPVIKPVAAESGTENYPYYKKLLQNPPPGATEKQNAENLVSALQWLSRMNEPGSLIFCWNWCGQSTRRACRLFLPCTINRM